MDDAYGRLGGVAGSGSSDTSLSYCSAYDPRTVVPHPACFLTLPAAHTPYIYRDEEIGRLLASAAQLPSKAGLRPRTFVTLFGLYAVTGLRCREPLQLDRTDVD